MSQVVKYESHSHMHEPTLIPRDNHPVSRKLLSQNALKVIYRLQSNGYEAYLVGGGVRDILLGKQPKDFDIATNAHPEQVHALFKNSRLIGRRFKLVHILFGREIIEVATFRGQSDSEQPSSVQHQSDSGMLLRDNVYGTIEEDAIRRDFTVNALYYNPKDFCVYDFLDSTNDIDNRQLRLIGDPVTRYREDPVRMLRAIRFAAKLDFEIEEQTKAPIRELASLLANIPPARLFDEVIKLFLSGHAVEIFRQLQEFDLLESLFPHVSYTLSSDDNADFYQTFIEAGLANTDKRILQEKPVTPAFLYATLLWPEVDRLWKQLIEEGVSDFPALQQAAHIAIQDQLPHIMIPKRFSLMMKEIWEFQIRLTKNRGRRVKELAQHKRFRAGYDFLLLREQCGDKTNGLAKWWTEYQEKNPQSNDSGKNARSKRPPRRRKRPNNSKPS